MFTLANRDRKLFESVRLCLAIVNEYHSPSYKENTRVQIRSHITPNELPLQLEILTEIYYRYLENAGITEQEVKNDLLEARRTVLNKERCRLQRIGETEWNYS